MQGCGHFYACTFVSTPELIHKLNRPLCRGKKKKRQEECTFLTMNHILTFIEVSLFQKQLLFQLWRRWKDRFYQREDLTSETPQWTAQRIFSIIRKRQAQGKLAKMPVHTLRNSLENHKFTSSFKRFFSDDSHPTSEKQWGTTSDSP